MQNDFVSGLIPLTNLDTQSFEKIISKLENFWKAKSIAYLDKFGLPTLEAVAITDWNMKIKQNLLEFCNTKNWNSVVIRTDKERETGKDIPRGGYQIGLGYLENDIKKHLQNGRIVMVLEPRDKFRNLYGINIIFDNPNTLYFEVVGPGFDVSNLNRGDITPHERFTVNIHGENLEISNHEIVSQSEYEKSVNYRYKQIGDSILVKNKPYTEKEKIESGKNFLKSHEYLLLENSKSYHKITKNYIKKIRNTISKLPNQMSKIGLANSEFVLSATIFDSEELVFWDIVFPSQKYGWES